MTDSSLTFLELSVSSSASFCEQNSGGQTAVLTCTHMLQVILLQASTNITMTCPKIPNKG